MREKKKKNKKEANWNYSVLKLLRSDVQEVLNKENLVYYKKVDLMVIKWEVLPRPTLEKRRLWQFSANDVRMTKALGMDIDDVKAIMANADEILKLMGEEKPKEETEAKTDVSL